MSKIQSLGDDLGNLPDILNEYENELDGIKEHLGITGKTLEQANKENAAWYHYYDHKRVELKTVVDFLEMRVQRIRGKLFKSYTEHYNREISDRSKDKYIDNEEAFLTAQQIYLEAKEVYQKYQSAVDAFQTRGYALNNITKARVSEVHDVIL